MQLVQYAQRKGSSGNEAKAILSNYLSKCCPIDVLQNMNFENMILQE